MYAVIVGCGRLGAELASLLSKEGHNVVVVDKNVEAFKRLGPYFNGDTHLGNGFEMEVLEEVGIDRADAFCSVTDCDNVNIMAAQVAKKIFNVPRAIARVYDCERASIYQELGLEVISGSSFFASLIRNRLMDRRLTEALASDSNVAFIEFEVNAKTHGKRVEELALANDFSVVAVLKKGEDAQGKPIIPGPKMILEAGVTVYGIVRIASLKKVRKALGIALNGKE